MNGVLSQVHIDRNLIPRLDLAPWVLGASVVVLAVAYFLHRKWKARRAAAGAGLTTRSLRRIWKAFLRQIPPEFRRHVLFFQPFVVFGEAASGKSLIISKYTDWKGQAAQFYSSYSVDPALQIYLGSRALVQEVPATLLADSSQTARSALINVWSPIFKKRDPIVIVTLSAAALKSSTAEALRTQAQMLRGKINVLSRLVDKSVTVRIVLTHMDQIEGYRAFSDFVEKNGIPHQLTIDPKSKDAGLATCLEPIEAYLSTALVTLPAQSYLKVLTFLNKAPETFQHLGIFVSTLTESDPLSFDPEVKDLYLASDTAGSPSAISNPFASSWVHQSVAIERAVMARHRLVTRAIVAAALIYLAAGFFLERRRLYAASDALTKFEQTHEPELAALAADKVADFTQGRDSPIAHAIFPSFFRSNAVQMRDRLLSTIRTTFLIPQIREHASSSDAAERTLYVLGLLYSSNDNQLGRYVSLKTAEWARVLDIPEPVVADYVRESDTPWNEPVAIPTLGYDATIQRATQLEPWHSLFIEVNRITDQKTIAQDELKKLQRDATEMRTGLDIVLRKSTAREVYGQLKTSTLFDKKPFAQFIADQMAPSWLTNNLAAMEQLLELVRSSSVDVAPFTKGNLYELVYRLRGIQALARVQTPAIRVSLDERVYLFKTGEWQDTINNGKIRHLVQQFIKENQGRGKNIFFATAGTLADVSMRPPTSSDFLFPGRGTVEGYYTRAAWDRVVRPQLEQFEGLQGSFVLEKDVQDELARLIEDAIQQYAIEYATQWRKFQKSWRVQADNLTALKIVLGQMKLPTSRFQEFLARVRENTAFDEAYTQSQYFRPMLDHLAAFQPLNNVSAIDSGSLTELEKYRRILGRINTDLDQQTDSGEKAEPGAKVSADYEQSLKPAAQLAYHILVERESFMLLTQDWLKKNGIADEWRNPFLEPVQALYRLGLSDMEDTLHKSWEREVASELQGIIEKFPFNPNAVADATPRDVETVLHPTTGTFWKAFRRHAAPLVVEERGTWRPIRGLETGFNWPYHFFEVLNHLSQLTATLWDKDKNPRPIVVECQPEPLPIGKQGKPQVVLSFINVGKNSVFGFNQKYAWQTLNVEWWTRPTAEVGLQVGDPENPTSKPSRQLNEAESAWSFFRLLLRDRQSEHNVYIWNLAKGEPEYPPPLIKYTFRQDPWATFRVPSLKEKTGS